MFCVCVRENDYGNVTSDVGFTENIGNVPPCMLHTAAFDLLPLFNARLPPAPLISYLTPCSRGHCHFARIINCGFDN